MHIALYTGWLYRNGDSAGLYTNLSKASLTEWLARYDGVCASLSSAGL